MSYPPDAYSLVYKVMAGQAWEIYFQMYQWQHQSYHQQYPLPQPPYLGEGFGIEQVEIETEIGVDRA